MTRRNDKMKLGIRNKKKKFNLPILLIKTLETKII